MQMELQLSEKGNNYLELAITIMQHLNQGRTPKINPQIRQEATTAVYNRPEAPNTIEDHQEPYKSSHANPTADTTILVRPGP